MSTASLATYAETLRALGLRARQLRLVERLTQAELARRAGVGLATVQRFERSGHGSLDTAVRLATALRVEATLDALFAPPAYASLDEALGRPTQLRPQRVRRRR